MRSELERWGIRGAVVLRDHPAAEFEAVTPVVRHDLFLRLSDALDLSPEEPAAGAGERTLFTERHSEGRAARVRLRADRPALVVSPTSWTDDEDFELLVAALGALASLIRRDEKREPDFPHLVLLITGEGRNRARFERRLEGWRDGRVRVRTAFLSAEDYTLALGSADLGLCLHRSSSRVDLPMKIADMYGAGVPVCAYDYGPCIREQVEEGVTGVLFRDAASLARVLHDLFRGFPAQAPRLEALRQNVMRRPRRSWEQNWEEVLWPLLDRRSPPGGPGG
jgi:beta-1,4-mannosyltransferase